MTDKNKTERVERAKVFVFDNDRTRDSVFDNMADFAASEVAAAVRAERERIAGEIEAQIARYKTPRAQVLSIKANVVDRLKFRPRN